MTSFKIEGLEELKKALSKKKMSLEHINEAVEKATEKGYQDAVSNCPVRTGELKNSIEKRIEGTTGIVEAKARYAQFVEFGTKSHGAAQPFMRPAQKVARQALIGEALKLVESK